MLRKRDIFNADFLYLAIPFVSATIVTVGSVVAYNLSRKTGSLLRKEIIKRSSYEV
jgi:hypothetical protein